MTFLQKVLMCLRPVVMVTIFGLCHTGNICFAACLIFDASSRSDEVMNVEVAAESNPVRSALTDAQIDAATEQVMSDHVFRSLRRRILENPRESDADKGFLRGLREDLGSYMGSILASAEKILQRLLKLISGEEAQPASSPSVAVSPAKSSNPVSMEGPSQVLVSVFLTISLLIALVLAIMAVRAIDRRRRREADGRLDFGGDPGALKIPPGEIAVTTYETRAVQFAGAGNYPAAIRELLLGAMSWVERAGLIRYRKGLTNRDYLRAIRRQSEKRSSFEVVAAAFEYIFFGRRPATRDMFDRCLVSFQEAFRDEQKPTGTN